MTLKGMLKWAVGKDDRPINSTKSLKKRRKLQVDMQSGDASLHHHRHVELISGCCKHRPINSKPVRLSQNNKEGPSGFVSNNNKKRVEDEEEPPDNNNSIGTAFQPNYQKKDSSGVFLHIDQISGSNNNNNNVINSDSKSLLYMSLDHLPMAIVKQYERMLQDAPPKPPPQSILKVRPCSNNIHNLSRSSGSHNSSKKSKSVRLRDDGNADGHLGKSRCEVTSDLTKSSGGTTTTNTTNTIINLTTPTTFLSSKSLKSETIKLSRTTNLSATSKNNVIISERNSSPPVSIKEATNRPLRVVSKSSKKTEETRTPKTPSPNEKYPHTSSVCLTTQVVCKTNSVETKTNSDIPGSLNSPQPKLQDSTCGDHTGPANEKQLKETCVMHENDENSPPSSISHSSDDPIKVTEVVAADEVTTMKQLPSIQTGKSGAQRGLVLPHDTTDPEFLEKSVTYSSPPVPRCAKKLTLKRSELRKLERLKSQTERLNRFLRKYYHDCLPNLPEEEDEQCSPEEKSLCLSILRTHWREVKTNGGSSGCSSSSGGGGGGGSEDRRHSWSNRGSNGSRRAHLNDRRKPYPQPSSNNRSSNVGNSLVEQDDDDDSVDWENLRNAAALISYSNDSCLLPIIQEDSAEVSSSTGSSSISTLDDPPPPPRRESSVRVREEADHVEMCRKASAFDDSFLMSSTDIHADDSFVVYTKNSLGLNGERRDSGFVKISFDEEEEEGGFGVKKLKALKMEPLGDLFETPASLAEDEGFMSPYPPEVYSPASSSSTFNRFSLSSSGKGSGCTQDENYDDYDKDEVEISNLPHTQQSSSSSSLVSSSSSSDITSEGGEKYSTTTMKHENANYLHEDELSNKDETWNSHGCYIPTHLNLISPCGSLISSNSQHFSTTASSSSSSTSSSSSNNETSSGLALAFNTTPMISKCTGLRSYRLKKTTPRKVVRKPPVNSAFSGKGEVLIRTYKNGDYATVHVVQARKLQVHRRSSWKLSIKISLLPEAEATLTRSESILVSKNRSWVKIDQKFSFEISDSGNQERKVFLTFAKRLEKKTSFLGWTTLDIAGIHKNSQCWLKLRKRKMSTATAFSVSHCSSTFMGGQGVGLRCVGESPSPTHVDEGPSPTRGEDYDLPPKSQLQTSSTMDSGVEDCCEGGGSGGGGGGAPTPTPGPSITPNPPPVPTIELDEKTGRRVNVKMVKGDGCGYGFSVVWVSPPRIERLEAGKAADLGGLRIGDLIIGVNGEEVTLLPNTTIYTKMKTTGNELELDVWRKHPQAQPRTVMAPPPSTNFSSKSSSSSNTNETVISNDVCQNQTQCAACLPVKCSSTITTANPNSLTSKLLHPQPPPVSILKPPPPAPPSSAVQNNPQSQQQNQPPATGSSAWRIRFNIELLDNEDDTLKQFFICELKFFRKVVAALDRYLIPAQANSLLTPQEINLIFANVIKIITVTKRILNCVANGSSASGWQLGRILLSTHSDHLSEIVSAYTAYAKTLGYSAMILSDKMSNQQFATFVLATVVPKGHLDMTSLLFAPFEHLRNICEICEEIHHHNEDWVNFAVHLKECYADIVCETDFMEPISHISMKKNPLLSVRDLEKRIVSTTCQAVKVCEKGRKWLFGSRLYKKESDGSWSPVWAFLFSDIIVLTSHTTRDRVFFVKEPPIRLEDVTTLHFNLPRKHENEFRLLFGPEQVPLSRLDKILPIHRNKKTNQIILRTPNVQLKSMWKLLLQKQIICLNTRLSKSSSSNFSISEFCERFPVTPQDEGEDEATEVRGTPRPKDHHLHHQHKGTPILPHKGPPKLPTASIFERQNFAEDQQRNLGVIKEERSASTTAQLYTPDGLSSMNKDLFNRSRVSRLPSDRRVTTLVEVIPEEIKVTSKPINDPTDTNETATANLQPYAASSPVPRSVIPKQNEVASINGDPGECRSSKILTNSPKLSCSSISKKSPLAVKNNNNNSVEVRDMNGCCGTEADVRRIKETSHGGNDSVCANRTTTTPKKSPLGANVEPELLPSNQRVEALKYEGVGNMANKLSKPGPRIITNAHLKSLHMSPTNKPKTTMTTSDPSASDSDRSLEKTLDSSVSSKSGGGGGPDSLSPLLPPRCQSENGYVKPKTIHADSPILSDRTRRRRILYDYKVRKDYPELFGITPKDRRSFIKSLADKPAESDRSLVAPYYFSPVPTPKFPKGEAAGGARGGGKDEEKEQRGVKTVESSVVDSVATKTTATTTTTEEEEEEEERTEMDVSLKEIVRGMLRQSSRGSEEEEEEEEEGSEEDSDDEESEEEEEERRAERGGGEERQRSPEESSNDSGISDEATTTTRTEKTEGVVVGSEVNLRAPSNNHAPQPTSTPKRVEQSFMPNKALACKSKSKCDDYFVEGDEATAVEAVVVLKADKSTATDDEPAPQQLHPHPPQWTNKRTFLAQRREAFFTSFVPVNTNNKQCPSSVPPPASSECPLIVKIVDGGTLHSTDPPPPPLINAPTERVLLTRYPEKERITPRVERVESSDDSTSSDLASASPAAENGTTDPSWSSSSSSLAGKDESSSLYAPSDFNNEVRPSCSTKVVSFNDLPSGLPSSTFGTSTSSAGLKVSLTGPEIVVTQESPDTPTVKNGYSSDGEEEEEDEDSSVIACGSRKLRDELDLLDDSSGSERRFLRVESNDSTAENYGDDDDYNFDDEDDLSQCSVATINRYGTFESLEKIESEDSVGGLPDFSRPMPRSKARFTFEDEDSDDDNDLFEEDFESDFNFRFPSQIQDNTYSVSRLGPLPPLLEEDFEDDMYEEGVRGSDGSSPCSSSAQTCSSYTGATTSQTLRSRHELSPRSSSHDVCEELHQSSQDSQGTLAQKEVPSIPELGLQGIMSMMRRHRRN